MVRLLPSGLILSALLLASCGDLTDGLAVLQGNAAFQRGEFQRASLNYLEVPANDSTRGVVLYNLGNVYNALGEANSALAAWRGIAAPTAEELLFRLSFNKGHLLYQRGKYEEAYNEFKTALTLKPGSLETKKNLELSLVKVQSFGLGLSPRATSVFTAPRDTEKAMLDYIKRLEGSRWKANNQPESSSASSSDW